MRDRWFDFLMGCAVGSILTTLFYVALLLLTEVGDNDLLECVFLGLAR